MKLRQALQLASHLGPGWCVFRVRHALRMRLGLLKRATPALPWTAFANEYAEGRFPKRGKRAPLPDDPDVLAEASDIMAGRFRLYSVHTRECGFPPAWNTDAFTGRILSADRHWTTIPDFGGGDIKDVWELSRFPWVFPLVRAHGRDGREAYPETFWRLFEDWLAANSPNLGPQWKCGQEATFRLMAATFGRHAFSECASTTPARLAAWRAFVLATGRRIEPNLAYALSQSNNHGVSECVGLLTCALMLPGAPESGRWLRKGLAALRSQLERLVYADGSFSQHSVNYHRVMLHDLCWAVALFRSDGREVPAWLRAAGLRALGWLESMTDPVSGYVPWSGSNDGAHILPLASGGYSDFRPVLALSCALFREKWPADPGPWDEAAMWLAPGMAGKVDAQPPVSEWHARDGGWHILRHENAHALLRAPEKFRHRPCSADMLHVDLWWRGFNITRDPGSYSYNTAGPFESAFKCARVHDTVSFDGLEPLQKFGRFLYLPWPTGSVDLTNPGVVSATHSGWDSIGAAHRRTVRFADGAWLIEDRLTSSSPREARLHWLFADVAYDFDTTGASLLLHTPVGQATVRWRVSSGTASATLIRADERSDRGWASPAYRQAVPALSLAVTCRFSGELTFITEVRFGTEASRP